MKNNNLKELLLWADSEKFAIPAFNYSDVWQLLGILEAADEEKAPVIISANAQVINTFGFQFLTAQGNALINSFHCPVIHHLDHSCSVAMCRDAIDAGFRSVMIDASARSLDENIAATKEVVAWSAGRDVCVEAEIGRIRGNNVEGAYWGDDYLVKVEDAVKFTAETKVDSLAVGIGNAHGFYTEHPKLNFQRLKEVNEAVGTPLVLHGGTGIPPESISEAIKNGINKVNIGTENHHTYLQAVTARMNLEGNPKTNVIDNMLPVKDAVKETARKWIRICMADNRWEW